MKNNLSKIIVLKAYDLSYNLVKDKTNIFIIKNIIKNAIEQTVELRKVFYFILLHEVERRLDDQNKEVIKIRKKLMNYCEEIEKDITYDIFLNFINATTGSFSTKQSLGTSDLIQSEIKELGKISTTGSDHFNIVDLNVNSLSKLEKRFLEESKFIDLIKKHKINY